MRRLSFHKFPTDSNACREWVVKNCGDEGPNFKITSNMRVCSAHFVECDFPHSEYADTVAFGGSLRWQLRSSAVPSVFAWSRGNLKREAVGRVTRPVSAVKKKRLGLTMGPVPEQEASESSSELNATRASIDNPPCVKETQAALIDHDYCRSLPDVAGARQFTLEFEWENEELSHKVASLERKALTIERVTHDDCILLRLIGLPSYAVFCTILEYIRQKASLLIWWRGKGRVAAHHLQSKT